MSGFDDRNRYSYSGADARAYAFYPLEFEKDAKAAAGYSTEVSKIQSKIAQIEKQQKQLELSTLPEDRIRVSELQSQIIDLLDQISLLNKHTAESIVHLESMATISFQVHEPKAPARALGYRAPKGFARSVRTIAGTMIFTVVENHPLAELAKKSQLGNKGASYSLDQDTFGKGTYRGMSSSSKGVETQISTLLKPFNLIVRYSTEVLPTQDVVGLQSSVKGAPIASYMLEGIEIVSEGITTSVNDMVTEVVMQFQAHNVYQLSITHESPDIFLSNDILLELYDEFKQVTEEDIHSYESRMRSHQEKEMARRKLVERQAYEDHLRQQFGAEPGESATAAMVRRTSE